MGCISGADGSLTPGRFRDSATPGVARDTFALERDDVPETVNPAKTANNVAGNLLMAPREPSTSARPREFYIRLDRSRETPRIRMPRPASQALYAGSVEPAPFR